SVHNHVGFHLRRRLHELASAARCGHGDVELQLALQDLLGGEEPVVVVFDDKYLGFHGVPPSASVCLVVWGTLQRLCHSPTSYFYCLCLNLLLTHQAFMLNSAPFVRLTCV